jgi:hypothetical protein
VGFQHPYPAAEYVAVAASQHAAHKFAATPGAACNLLDRLPRCSQRLDRFAIVLPPQETIVLDALGRRQQGCVNDGGAERLARL